MGLEDTNQNEISSPVSDPSGGGSPTTPDQIPGSQAPVSPLTAQPSVTPSTDWDSDDNPYKYVAAQTAREMETLRQAQFTNEVRSWQSDLSTQGYSPEQIQGMTEQALKQYQLQQYEQQLDQKARPLVAHELSQKIASTYGIELGANDLLKTSQGKDITSVEAMLARADALVQERRKSNFDKRTKTGADNPGDSNTSTAPTRDFSKMSPAQKIQHGLRQRGEV